MPIPWFVLFDDAERRFLQPPEGPGPRLLYLTTVTMALQRLERVQAAIDVVEDADELLAELDDITEWLGGFDGRSLLELDYAGLDAPVGP